MAGLFECRGCRTIIYELGRSTPLADTTIFSSDRENDTILISRFAFQRELPSRVSLLVFASHGLFEYMGTVRKTSGASGMVELYLYRGKSKEGRRAKRYTVNSPATVRRLVIAKKLVPLRSPLPVTVVNISTGGCLIRGGTKFFNIDSSFELIMEDQGNAVAVYAKVLHVKTLDLDTAEYGCRFQPA